MKKIGIVAIADIMLLNKEEFKHFLEVLPVWYNERNSVIGVTLIMDGENKVTQGEHTQEINDQVFYKAVDLYVNILKQNPDVLQEVLKKLEVDHLIDSAKSIYEFPKSSTELKTFDSKDK